MLFESSRKSGIPLQAFQIVDPYRAADSAANNSGAQPIHRTVRPGDTILADSGSANGAKLGPFIALVRQVRGVVCTYQGTINLLPKRVTYRLGS